MENRWLLTWVLAPIFSPGATVLGAYTLRWYRLDADLQTISRDRSDSIASSVTGTPVRHRARIVVTALALMLLAACFAAAQDTPGTLVAVVAHPDDEGPAAPILARYAREGANVYLVIATDGSQGGTHTSIPRGPDLGRVRRDEARCAADALDIHPPILLDFPDAALGNYTEDRERLFRLTQQLQKEIERLRPDAVLTWGPDGGTGHPDHRLVGSIVTQLVRAGAPGAPQRLFYFSIPAEGVRMMNPGPTVPAFLVPLAKYFTVRIAFTPADADAARLAMACHRTQYGGDVVQKISDLQRLVWNGAISLIPFSPADAGTDLFVSR
jgi:LmbE family N-acetylglucosaminyl deacetylase